MTKKLFVGGLAWATDNDRLAAAFSEFGTVEEARVIMDRDSGRSKGFGFVTMDTEEAAQEAMAALNETMIDGRNIRVSEAHAKTQDGRGDNGRNDYRPARTDNPSEPEVVVRRRGDGGSGGSRMPRKPPLKR